MQAGGGWGFDVERFVEPFSAFSFDESSGEATLLVGGRRVVYSQKDTRECEWLEGDVDEEQSMVGERVWPSEQDRN